MRTETRHWRNLLLVAVVAVLCFGGSFTRKGSTHNDDGNGASGSVNVR